MSSAVAEPPLALPAVAAPFAWPSGRPLLAAEWRHLVMLNYAIDPSVLAPFVPVGTQLDSCNGETYASVVGFLFQRAQLCGVRIPFHGSFEEVNLRFYVRRETSDECRRGVVFVRELAPRRAVALVANRLYGEKYLTVPMSHQLTIGGEPGHAPRELAFQWKLGRRTHALSIQTAGDLAVLPGPESHEQFIVEHYWGYTALPRRHTAEYQVAHPPWRLCAATLVQLDVDVARLYGAQFVPFLRTAPVSAFWADGSAVRVYRGHRIA